MYQKRELNISNIQQNKIPYTFAFFTFSTNIENKNKTQTAKPIQKQKITTNRICATTQQKKLNNNKHKTKRNKKPKKHKQTKK